MRRVREWIHAHFDWHALVLLIPLFVLMQADVFLTLLGQSVEYWNYFWVNGGAMGGFKGYISETALFGFAEFILKTHPLVFLAAFQCYFLLVAACITSRFFSTELRSFGDWVRRGVRLALFWGFLVAHGHGAFSWLDSIYFHVLRNIPEAAISTTQKGWLGVVIYWIAIVGFAIVAQLVYEYLRRRSEEKKEP